MKPTNIYMESAEKGKGTNMDNIMKNIFSSEYIPYILNSYM